jgi:hypothetical protein
MAGATYFLPRLLSGQLAKVGSDDPGELADEAAGIRLHQPAEPPPA